MPTLHPGADRVRIVALLKWGETKAPPIAADCHGLRPLVTSTPLIEKCCIIANPVAGNPTHYIVENAFAQAGLDWRFMTFEVARDRLGEAMGGLRALGFHGVKIGEPFQGEALSYLDEATERARRAGSINTLTARDERLVGDNTEGAAIAALAARHAPLAGARVLVIGAGRLARAAAAGFAEQGVREVVLAVRNAEAGRVLAGELASLLEIPLSVVELKEAPLVIDADVAMVVNATSLGMEDPHAKLPIDLDSLRADLVVVETAYHSAQTWLTRAGAERGCPVVDGLEVFIEQTALAIEGWTAVEPDRVAMREAAEEFLGI